MVSERSHHRHRRQSFVGERPRNLTTAMRSSIADQHHVPSPAPIYKKHIPVLAVLFLVAVAATATLVVSLTSTKSNRSILSDGLGSGSNFTTNGNCYPSVDVILLMDDSMSEADKYHTATDLVLDIVESLESATEQASRFGLVMFDTFASNVVELGAFDESADFVTFFSDLRASSFSKRQSDLGFADDQFCIPAAFQMGLQTTLALDASTGLVQPTLTRLRPGVRTVFILVTTREHGTAVFSECDASFVDCLCDFPEDDAPFQEPVADMQNAIQQITDASSALYPLDVIAIGIGESVSDSFLDAVTDTNFGVGQEVGLPVNASDAELAQIVVNVTEVVLCPADSTRAPTPLSPTQAPTTCESRDTDVVFVVDSSVKQNNAPGVLGNEFVIAAVNFTSELASALASKTTGTSRFALTQFASNASSMLQLTPDLNLFDQTAQTILSTASVGPMQRAAGDNFDLQQMTSGEFEFGPRSLLRTGVPSTIVLITDAFAESAPENELICLSQEPCECASLFKDPRAAALNVYDAIVQARTASGDDVLVLIVGTGSVPQRFMEEVADTSMRVPTHVELNSESAVDSALDSILCRATTGSEQGERPSPTATSPPTDVPTKKPSTLPTGSPVQAPSATPTRAPSTTRTKSPTTFTDIPSQAPTISGWA